METENKWTRKEIESHSSALTNMRLDKFLLDAGILSAEVTSSRPDPELSMRFFGSAIALFWQTHFVYSEKDNAELKKEIDRCISEANAITSRFQIYQSWTAVEVVNLNQLTLRALYLMVQGLQNMRYFLRMGSQEAKGLDAALELFNLDIWKKKEKKNDTTISAVSSG